MEQISVKIPSTQPLNHSSRRKESQHNYVIILSSGPEDGGKRATLAFSAACTAVAMDMNPCLFMVGDGSYWAYQGHTQDIHSHGFPPLEELISSYLELEGSLYLCSACDATCALPHLDGSPSVKRSGVEVRGMASVLQHSMAGSSITF